jgi:hypothetical protein
MSSDNHAENCPRCGHPLGHDSSTDPHPEARRRARLDPRTESDEWDAAAAALGRLDMTEREARARGLID